MTDLDKSKEIVSSVKDAINSNRKLNIVGGDTKKFYGSVIQGEPLYINQHSGVTNYQPTELVISVRAGTSLYEVESILNEKNQRLLFEPPHYGKTATIGGTVSADMNGAVRPWSGSVKDAVLGIKMINGRGEILHFGGEVMKNVAGYDVSRLMVGSMGTLGVLLEISLKVVPLEKKTITLMYETTEQEAIQRCSEINRRYLPLSAMTYYDNILYLRLSGHESSVNTAYKNLGGVLLDDINFWSSIREQTHAFFKQTTNLWRLSVPAATPKISGLSGDCLIDWGGAQRWYASDLPIEEIRSKLSSIAGHATLYRKKHIIKDVFHPLTEKQKLLHKMVKQSFDPNGIFNRGRMYEYL